jgi:OOP family OmpA-OmpF porin
MGALGHCENPASELLLTLVPHLLRSTSSCRARLATAAAFALAVSVPFATPTAAGAADKQGAKDFPSISRFKGAEIVEYQTSDYDEAVLPTKPVPGEPPPPASLIKAEGKVTSITYVLPPGKTSLEAMRNYEQALGAGFKTVFSCAGDECGRDMGSYIGNSGKVVPSGWGHMSFETDKNRYLLARRSAPGGDVWVLLYAMQETNHPTVVFQKTVEVKAMQSAQVSVLDAATLQRGLEAEGKVAVYGIYFETAKADVKTESKAALDEMAKLLDRNRGLRVYIVGHTDNAGTLAANLELSQHRADAVAKALTATYKVDPQRLTARGVASLAPVSSNADEGGRARNRRVELVVQ